VVSGVGVFVGVEVAAMGVKVGIGVEVGIGVLLGASV
jgi:hypothetical protein